MGAKSGKHENRRRVAEIKEVAERLDLYERIVNTFVPGVFHTDPYALKLYENALKHGKEKEKSIRVNIVGNFNQGKTSLLRRLLGQSIDKLKSTNGIDIERIECNTSNDSLFLYEDLASDYPMYVKRIFAIAESERMTTKQEVPKTLKTVIETEHTNSIENSEASSILSHDNVFQSQRCDTYTICNANVSEHVASKPKKTLLNPAQLSELVVKAEQTTTSTTKGDIQTRISIRDLRRQIVLYVTHSLFHSRGAIYLLVFDLSTKLSSVIADTDCPVLDDGRTMQYFFEFRMNSIHSFVGTADGSKPLVLLVGTHKDKVPGDEKTQKKSIDKYCDDINCDQADLFRRFAESVVLLNEFRKIKQADDQYIRPYSACYKRNDESHGVTGREKIEEIEYLDGSEYVICPDLKSHSSFTVVNAKSQWFTDINLTKQEAAVYLTDKVIRRISQHIGKDWKQLGQQLGLTRAQIDHIIEGCPMNATIQKFRMLQIWLNESGNSATMGTLVDAMKKCRAVNIDWNEIRNLAEECTYECTYGTEESTTMGGEQFKKSVDDTMNETTVRLMREGMKSVGVLVYPGGYGTVFRVGSKCVMTALHLVQNVLDTTRLEESDVYVDFNESCIQPDRKVYHLTKTVLHERVLDMAILEISDPDENLPSALYLEKHIYAVAKFETVSVIGYGHPQKMEKVLDPNCKVIPPNSAPIIHAIRWLSEKSSKFKQIMSMTLKDAALVDQGYRGYDMPDKFLMHCYLQHGASGAPVVAINGLKLVVVGMLTHGLPEFYFKLSETHKKLVDNELLFEVGSRMSSIYLCIQSKDPNLARNLFGE